MPEIISLWGFIWLGTAPSDGFLRTQYRLPGSRYNANFLDQLSSNQLLKDSAPWRLLLLLLVVIVAISVCYIGNKVDEWGQIHYNPRHEEAIRTMNPTGKLKGSARRKPISGWTKKNTWLNKGHTNYTFAQGASCQRLEHKASFLWISCHANEIPEDGTFLPTQYHIKILHDVVILRFLEDVM
jgi:hypothetical protein